MGYFKKIDTLVKNYSVSKQHYENLKKELEEYIKSKRRFFDLSKVAQEILLELSFEAKKGGKNG